MTTQAGLNIADAHDPTAQAVRELIDLDGGPLALDALGGTLRNEDFLHTLVTLDFLQERLNKVSLRNGSGAVSVHVTRSPSMGASVRSITPEHAAALVPVGTIARVQVIHRLLLGYFNRDRQVPEILASMDDRPFERRLPRALVPLLRDLQVTSDWWETLDTLNASIELDASFGPDVSQLNHLALSVLLGHEFVHVCRRHTDVRRRVRVGELSFEVGDGEPRPATDAELCRAMENDADRMAAYLAVWTLLRQTEATPNERPLGFTRLAYAVTALLALFDPQKLSIMHFGTESAYPHPAIRHLLFLEHIAECATGVGVPAREIDSWLKRGVQKALDALAQLEFDIYSERRFCEEGEQVDPVIHALRPSRINMLRLARSASTEDVLSARLNTLLTSTNGEFILL